MLLYITIPMIYSILMALNFKFGLIDMYSFVFYAPIDYVERIKEAMFDAGGGVIGNYKRCAWQVQGVGQFEPIDGSDPFLGSLNNLERVDEYKVEMVVADDKIHNVLQAFKQAHPYEEPAYFIARMSSLD